MVLLFTLQIIDMKIIKKIQLWFVEKFATKSTYSIVSEYNKEDLKNKLEFLTTMDKIEIISFSVAQAQTKSSNGYESMYLLVVIYKL